MIVAQSSISSLKFKGKWRSYQKRVLDELIAHLDDDRLNVVAAPGAGKTILGIEVMTRLAKPALILAPTITIKNQWKQRIIENFLIGNSNYDFISTEINNVQEITISTYQGLHSIYKNKNEREEFLKNLRRNNIKTLILDEAHHLRTEWWLTLNDLYSQIKGEDFKIIALTGTPPYDVPACEWNNYNSLCGPVDAEISIPELVKAGDLCPHQDLIYFSNLTAEEKNIVYDYEKKRNEFFKFIKETPDLLYTVESSSFLNELDNNPDIIYKDINFTVSIISFLLNEDSLNENARILAEFIGLQLEQIPEFDYQAAQVLLNGILNDFKTYFKNTAGIKSKLRELKLVNGKNVDLTAKTDFKKLFARSLNKLNALYDISKFEYTNLKASLREVILLDYIGKGDSEGLNIFSVFEKLHNLNIPCAVLTGSLIVIPQTAKDELYKILDSKNIDRTKVLTSEFNKNYLRVETYGNVDIVSVITSVFEKGCINILIGTAALLGEGWDSPCVNTLIIASVVGSFMLSNQMRGRALRVDKTNPQKTSDIWHLVSLYENYEQSQDFDTIVRRFNTFEGISYKDDKIQSGIERLDIPFNEIKSSNCMNLNNKMFKYAKNRYNLQTKWNQVFEKSLISEKYMAPKIYDVILAGNTQNSIKSKDIPNWCVGLNSLITNISIDRKKKEINFLEKGILSLCYKFKFLPENYENLIYENFEIYKKQNNIQNIANCLLKTLCDLYIIKSDYKKIQLKFNKELNSDFYITLAGCSNYERNLFLKTFKEVFTLKENNRYIVRQNEIYFAVPESIGLNRKNVNVYVKYLEQCFGYLDVIYTRNPNGYKELLKARYSKLKYDNIKQGRIWI